MVADSPSPHRKSHSKSSRKVGGVAQQEDMSRLVIWPKGSLLFATNPLIPTTKMHDELQIHSAASNAAWNSVNLALRLLHYHFFHRRSFVIRLDEWRKIARQKMRFTDELSTAIFLTAQCVVLPPMKLNDDDDWRENLALSKSARKSQKIQADLLALVAVVALLGCRRRSGADIVEFLHKNMDRICWLLLLCHYDLAVAHVLGPKFSEDDRPSMKTLEIPLKALHQLDILFEGTLIEVAKRKASCHDADNTKSSRVIPQSFGALIRSMFAKRNGRKNLGGENFDQKISFVDLVSLINSSLQNDMFLLDVENGPAMQKSSSKTVRTITSTQLAEHRKITVRQWHHLELLTNPIYAASNLRILNCKHQHSAIFHLRWLRTAAVVNCINAGPIVLGPVRDFLLLKRVQNTTVCAVSKRVCLVDCQDVRLFINAEASPVIISSEVKSRGIELAPYNVFYDGLFYELAKAGMQLLDPSKNAWDSALEIDMSASFSANSDEKTSSNGREPSPYSLQLPKCCSLLKPENFFIQPTPFRQTETSPFHQTFVSLLPPQYWEKWSKDTRRKAIQAANQIAISDCDDDDEKKPNEPHELKKIDDEFQNIRDFIPLSNTDLNYLLRRIEVK